jgi:hypothetical protein
MKRYMGEWRYSSTVLDIGTRWRWVVSFTPRPLYPRGNPPPPFLGTHWIGGWVCLRAGLDHVEKRTILQCRESNPGRPGRSPSLSRHLISPEVLKKTTETGVRTYLFNYLFICSLFNDAVSISYCTGSDDLMIVNNELESLWRGAVML